MPAKRYAKETYDLHDNDVRIMSVDFTGLLDSGDTLTGTPTVAEDADTPSLVITQAQVSTTALFIKRQTVPAGRAVLFKADRNDAAAGDYEIDILVSTVAGQTLPATVRVTCV